MGPRSEPRDATLAVRPQAATVFDTNAYRGRVHGAPERAKATAAALVRSERAAGIRALASPWVMVDLMAHLADPSDKDYRICAGAVQALWAHCCDQHDSEPSLATLVNTEAQLCQMLYGELPEGHLPAEDLLVGIAKQVHDDASPDAMAEARSLDGEIHAERRFLRHADRHSSSGPTWAGRTRGGRDDGVTWRQP